MSDANPTGPTAGPPVTVRAAALVVGLQALATLGFAVFLVATVRRAQLGVSGALGEAGFFALVALVLGAMAVALLRGRFWARTPAIVVQILLLPVGYSLLVPSDQVAAGVVVLLVALTALGLLLCRPSREWSEGLDTARRR